MKVRNKEQMYDLLRKGAFGNHMPFYEKATKCEEGITIGVRCLGRPGLPCVPNVLPAAAQWIGEELQSNFHCDVVYYQAPPDHCIILQGELMDGPEGLWLEYSTVQEPMRAALAKEREVVSGLAARQLLKKHMTASSWADMEALLEQYPDSVVEFGIYSVCLGTLKGRNCLLWEVRSDY